MLYLYKIQKRFYSVLEMTHQKMLSEFQSDSFTDLHCWSLSVSSLFYT